MAQRDWPEIALEYIEGEESLRSLARRHAIPPSTLWDRARRENWEARRRKARAPEPLRGDPPPADARDAAPDRDAERIFRVTDKLVRRAEEILDGGAEVGARELGELMRAVKNAKEICMLRSALDEREQLARLRALEEKNGSGTREPLRIEFSPEAEEAAQ